MSGFDELNDAINELKDKCIKDPSDNICVVINYDGFCDMVEYLNARKYPVPKYVMGSPMHSDPKELDNLLQTNVR